jgi:hypothetical protein
MCDSDFALYGVTNGIMQFDSSVVVTCGVICSGWPSWAIGAEARGFNVTYVLTKTNVWSNNIKTWFPKAKVIDTDSVDWTVADHNKTIWLSDVDPPRKLRLWESQTRLVILRHRARHLPTSTSWRMTPLTISHLSCGGVTDGSWMVYIYSRDSTDVSMDRQLSSSGRDLNTILDTKTLGRPCAEPLKVPLSSTPRVIKLRGNTYHCNGLFPWSDRLAFVVSPSVFSPTNWVRRHLSGFEMMRVLDVPDSLHTSLTSSDRAHLCQDQILLPLKVVTRIIDSLPLPLSAPEFSNKRPVQTVQPRP